VVEADINTGERDGDLLSVFGLEDAGVAEECRQGLQRSWDVGVPGDGVDARLERPPPVGGGGPCRRPGETPDLTGGDRQAER
jgi:hypothetical protein